VIDPGLIPQPNPNPVTIDPTQDPIKFLFGYFEALKAGQPVSPYIKQPESFSVMTSRLGKYDCPSWYLLPTDALTVQSRTTGAATIRVKEKYFTGQRNIRDYYLVSDNGTWKISTTQNVGPEIVPPAGDPLSFVFDHFALLSHGTARQAYDNLDAEYQKKLSFEDFKREYSYQWFVPTKMLLESALSIESQTPDDKNPTQATVRMDPTLFTIEKIKTWDGKPADLLIELVNEDGKWRIHDIRRSAASKFRQFTR
jgi:hypothetical protein